MRDQQRLVVIGGVAAGMSAAAKVRRVNSSVDVTVFERGSYVSYGACGLPWFVCGRIPTHQSLALAPEFLQRSVCGKMPDENKLLARTPEQFKKTGINLHIRHEVIAVDLDRQHVRVRDLDAGADFNQPFDTLLIAAGARPIQPRIPGIDLPGVFPLKTLEDGLALRHYLESNRIEKAVIVGGGYIGLEMLDCLKCIGAETVVIDIAPRVLMKTFDHDMAAIVNEELDKNGVVLSVSDGVKGFEGNGRIRSVVTEKNRFPADLVILGLGVRPNVELAREAGITLGETGAIAVDDHARTHVSNVYSAGDCAEVHHLLLGKPAYIPLGSTANKQGRTAGTNIAGGDSVFSGVVGTAVSKVLNLEVARTGLTEEEARQMGYDVESAMVKSQSGAHYYPGTTPLWVKLIFEVGSMRLLGGQIIGEKGAAKRIDVLATALHQRMTIDDIRALDLGYAPPFSPVWDPILVAANVAAKE